MTDPIDIQTGAVMATSELRLSDLLSNTKCLTEPIANHFAESCAVSLHVNGHRSGVGLGVRYSGSDSRETVIWSNVITDEVVESYRDVNKRVDNAACAIALLLIRQLTTRVAILASATGDRVDYYLSQSEIDDTLIFNDSARLEVSGIHRESSSNSIQRRLRQKTNRLKKKGGPDSDSESTYICVVEFAEPKSEVVLV